MEISMFLVADYAYKEPSGKLSIIGVFSNIISYQFPTRHPIMHLVIVLQPETGEYGDTRTIRVVLVDEDGRELAQISGDLAVPSLDTVSRRPGSRPEIPVVLNLLGVEFQKPGTYEFRLFVDKEQKKSLPLDLIQSQPPGA